MTRTQHEDFPPPEKKELHGDSTPVTRFDERDRPEGKSVEFYEDELEHGDVQLSPSKVRPLKGCLLL